MDPKHEQTTNEATPRRVRASKKSESNPQAEMKIHKAEDDVLNVIENVESQIGALRKAHEEHRQVMADLGKRKRDLEEQAGELEDRESELSSREVELAEMRQDFETRETGLIQRASGLEQRESKIATQAELIEQQETDLESKDKTLEAKIQELDDQLAGLSKSKAELGELEIQAREKIAQDDESAAKLEIAKRELDNAKASLSEISGQIESVNTDLRMARESHDSIAAEHESAVSKLRGREIELNERSHTLEELAEKSGTIQHELDTAREHYGKQLADTAEHLTREQKTAQDLRGQIDLLRNEHDKIGSKSASQVVELSDRLTQANAEIESMRKSATDFGEQSEGRVSELASQLKDSQSKVKSLTDQVNEIAQCADDELTSEHKRADELKAQLESQIQTLTKQLDDTSKESTKLKAHIDSQAKIKPKELASLHSKLEGANKESTQSAGKLKEVQSALSNVENKLKSEIKARDEHALKAQSRVKELEAQSSELFNTIEELNTQLEEVKSAPKVDIDEWNQTRRDRLGKMRKILTGDAEKIRLATEALRSRYDQCEQVLSKRAELADAYEEISSTQRKYQNREVRSGVFLGLIGMAAIILAIAATSWFVSGRMSPGMYAAKVTIAAASGDTKLSEVDMLQWEAYITQLASDPRFLEVAADRMKRRGIAEFGVPGDLATEMQQSLDVASAMPGTIVMEYRGIGAQRSQRILDTFSVALSSAANNARARRADSSLTIIEEPALAGDTPLDSRRINTAGVIFGSGMFLTLLLGGVLWKRLSAAKSRFEKDSSVEVLFDEEQWQMPGS